MQSNLSKEQIQERLQRPGACPFVKCSVCQDNVLAYKPELTNFYRNTPGECAKIPVVGGIVQTYFEQPETRDSVVVSSACVHMIHFACFVKFARRFRIEGLQECHMKKLVWKCPDEDCDESHTTDANYMLRKRTAFNIGICIPFRVQINGKLFSLLSKL